MKLKTAVFWFRRDLRLSDNRGLYYALSEQDCVLPLFIFDRQILDQLPEKDARVTFIHDKLSQLSHNLQQEHNSSIAFYHGEPEEVFKSLLDIYDITAVYTNHDYEPYARERDERIEKLLNQNSIPFKSYKDQVIFEKEEVLKDDGDPYVVYTPYMRRWRSHFDLERDTAELPSSSLLGNLIQDTALPFLDLDEMGFQPSDIQVPAFNVSNPVIDQYEETRNFPGIQDGTSRLGPHLRFGTVSVRQMVAKAARRSNDTFLKELIWREFFMKILWHFPHTTTKAFKSKYDRIEWRNNEEEFEKWKQGETGYTLVDAGMRELNSTGYMHNRVRMLVASFLCKHLLIDWRWGEAYFAEKLLDYEMSSNVGNWQWAAGSGVDASPYFRIFNPLTQIDKFDKDRAYSNMWVPEAKGEASTQPIVDHKMARERCLEVYKAAVSS